MRPGAVAPLRDELRRIAFSGDPLLSTAPELRVSGAPISMSHAPTSAGWSSAGPRPEFSTPGGTLIAGPPGPAPLAMRLRALAIQRPQLFRYGAAGLALLVLVLVYQCGRHSEPVPEPAVAAADPTPEPEPSKPGKGKPNKGEAKAEAKPEAKAEPKPEPKPEPAAPPPADVTEIPAAFADAAQTLLTGSGNKARKKAAETITKASEADKAAIPEYVRNLAWLEKLSRCEDKRKVLLKLEEAGDLRALPGLQMVAKTPKNGCREWFTAKDCIACLREDLGRVIGRFEVQAEG
ncbi:hypothetical protein [Nannocystis pusilla]|uniref:hypothetical protein n=1 Tax=Nannocystis pusilla TaxID=889268 RepID=UPI003B7DD3A5